MRLPFVCPSAEISSLSSSIGHGKNHKSAASVRATHPIPAACGIYYFEVKIVSKEEMGKPLLTTLPPTLSCSLWSGLRVSWLTLVPV